MGQYRMWLALLDRLVGGHVSDIHVPVEEQATGTQKVQRDVQEVVACCRILGNQSTICRRHYRLGVSVSVARPLSQVPSRMPPGAI